MFFEGLVNRGSLPAMEKMLAFTEARHRVLTENIANVDTPGYTWIRRHVSGPCAARWTKRGRPGRRRG